MTAPTIRTDPDNGIPDLVSRLTGDSKRLVKDEVRLAKLEVRESLRDGARGALWLGVAFGISVIALAAFTIFASAGLGRLIGSYWAGTMITGALELLIAFLLIKKGSSTLSEPGYTLPETREELRETAHWVGNGRTA